MLVHCLCSEFVEDQLVLNIVWVSLFFLFSFFWLLVFCLDVSKAKQLHADGIVGDLGSAFTGRAWDN